MFKDKLRYFLIDRDENIREDYLEFLKEKNTLGMTGKIEKGKEILKLYIKKLCGEQNVRKGFFLSFSKSID